MKNCLILGLLVLFGCVTSRTVDRDNYLKRAAAAHEKGLISEADYPDVRGRIKNFEMTWDDYLVVAPDIAKNAPRGLDPRLDEVRKPVQAQEMQIESEDLSKAKKNVVRNRKSAAGRLTEFAREQTSKILWQKNLLMAKFDENNHMTDYGYWAEPDPKYSNVFYVKALFENPYDYVLTARYLEYLSYPVRRQDNEHEHVRVWAVYAEAAQDH